MLFFCQNKTIDWIKKIVFSYYPHPFYLLFIINKINSKGIITTLYALNTQIKNVRDVINTESNYIIPIKRNQKNFIMI